MVTSIVYGLRVRSPFALVGAARADDANGDVDVEIVIGAPTSATGVAFEPIHTSEHAVGSTPSLVADRDATDGTLRLRYAEGITFHVARDGRRVWVDRRDPMTEADASTFLLGPVMGSILRKRGVLALHASAVVIGGTAWAFVGPGGSGKSTLAAALARAGHPMLTEDVLAVRAGAAGWVAAPGYRAIRLWDDASALVAPGEDLPAATPTWPKRALDLDAHALPFATADAPLGGFIVLDDYLTPGEPPRVSPLGAGDVLIELIANVYANYAATGAELARELGVVRELAEAKPGWRLAPGAGSAGLSESCSAIESLVNG